MQDKREKVLHDVWSLTRQLEYLESEPKTQSNLVKRSKVYPKVAATIANKLGQILSQGKDCLRTVCAFYIIAGQ